MFKQVFRIAFVTLVWKQYKHIIVSTLVLFGFLFLVGNIHADFLKHAELQGAKTGLGISFVYKWLALAIGVVCYFAYHYLRTRQTNKKTNVKASQPSQETNIDDPFSNIRTRKKLRGRADFLTDKDSEGQ